ncbi:hypothetical protein PIB30_040807 [Stylosanthes scabra]|uniref:Uncharacterized protein n=1 Tax=Stylosanthes scabra TaxID=79078 RepID=A0ABU6TEK2_9FABA|nr:hypothetical protein [Stylosanthes scabra]
MGGGGKRSLNSVVLLGCKLDAREMLGRETVLWLATGPSRVGLITDLMSSLAVGTGMHHVHLFDIVWVCLLALNLIATCDCRFTFLEDKRSNEHNMVLDVLRCISLSHDYAYGDL